MLIDMLGLTDFYERPGTLLRNRFGTGQISICSRNNLKDIGIFQFIYWNQPKSINVLAKNMK